MAKDENEDDGLQQKLENGVGAQAHARAHAVARAPWSSARGSIEAEAAGSSPTRPIGTGEGQRKKHTLDDKPDDAKAGAPQGSVKRHLCRHTHSVVEAIDPPGDAHDDPDCSTRMLQSSTLSVFLGVE